ncbi:unnamed protein product [Rhizoctonia solani]|uniref:Uncharacterized protein n=1 Tax=Rhizoctonia solani TaxID=456999 RepID=A0A8H3E6V5_9AGAM|nr:unnamed protein product [Rhizoctonia solani]
MFPATEMIHSLLQEIEMAVSSSQHGLRVLYKIVERAQELYNELNQRISRVETIGSLDDFDVYTKAIDPLERALLEVLPAICDDRIHLMVPVSSDDLIESTEKWVNNNRVVCDCLRELGTEVELQGLASSSRDIETEILEANAQDYRDLFNELVLEILEKAPQCTQPNLQVLLKYVIRGLRNAQNIFSKNPLKNVDEEWRITSIKCAMLTRGLISHVTTSHNLSNDFGQDGTIWKRVLGMVSLINKAQLSEPLAVPILVLPPQDQQVVEPSSKEKVSTAESLHPSPALHPESARKPRTKPVLSVDTQLHDPTWFKRLQDPFPDPHTPTHAQRLSLYQTYNSASTQSPSPSFSIPTPVTARTPALRWLPGLQTALAFRSSSPLPYVDSVCGRLPLYRFLGFGFGSNS